jgi:lipopolysaccharide/colanic/teichoic acid biosynthesis glycosyltransferase
MVHFGRCARIGPSAELSSKSSHPMFSQDPFALQNRYPLNAFPALPAWKRVLDVSCCIAALPLLGIVTLVFAIIGVLFARGPVFFRQRNVGCLGRVYGAFRFRTMQVAKASTPDSESQPHQSEPTRLIPGGRFLRTSGLVDLPQIVNVLRGEMSVVGLRPCSESQDKMRDPAQRTDFAAVPGLTGLWRIAGESQIRCDEGICWERTYAAKMSFGSDLRMIGRTLLAIIYQNRSC